MPTSAFHWHLPLAQLPTVDVPGTAPAPANPPSAPAHPLTPAPAETNNAVIGPAAATAPATQGTIKETDKKDGGGPAAVQAPDPYGGLKTMIPIVLMFVVLYFVLFRGQKKEEKRRKSLIAEMKKGDRVLTIGGLIGRVVSIDNDEVVLKIDESANVKATYKKSSIHTVIPPNEEKPK